jgi:hypothetical protein
MQADPPNVAAAMTKEGNTVNLLRRLFKGNDRFERYYGDVIRAGAGYPTADEARRDMIRYHQSMGQHTWVR